MILELNKQKEGSQCFIVYTIIHQYTVLSIIIVTCVSVVVLILLLCHYSSKVPNVCFFPIHLSCLSTLGKSTALIIDIGYKETTVLPVSVSV